VWSRLREPVWDAWWAAWAHRARGSGRCAGRGGGEAIWQQVSGQLVEAGVGWQVQEALRRHVREPDGAWEWEWTSEIWPLLLAKLTRRAWLPPGELVVGPRASSDGSEMLWPAEVEDDADDAPDDASPLQLAEPLRGPERSRGRGGLDWGYWASVERGRFEKEARSGWYTRGRHDTGALAVIDLLDRAVGLHSGQPLAGQLMIGRSAGWWWPFEQVAILTDRPLCVGHGP
jgi:uncharacterized protein DUF6745